MTDLTTFLAGLRKIAEKATPGPWESVNGERQTDNWFSAIYGPAGDYKALLIGLCNQNDAHRDDAAHIAAINPAVALALLDVVEAAHDAADAHGEAAAQAWSALQNALSRLSSLASKP